ncbi:transcriptional regulator [Escherichia coli]|nr:transcriptional regulator [Escherichia coli]
MLRTENKEISGYGSFGQEDYAFCLKSKKTKLPSASLLEEEFWMLVEVAPLYSEKVICALRDFLVLGYTRREACEKHNVSLSYFSITLGRISHINRVMLALASYYDKAARHATDVRQ